MEKMDRLVALVGAALLVAGVAYAAVSGDPSREYALTYAAIELEGPSFDFPEGPLPVTGYSVELGEEIRGNVSLVEVAFTLTATAPTQGSMRATLVAPNGTVVDEQEAAIPPLAGAPVTMTVRHLAQPVPDGVRGSFPTQADAEAALVRGPANATGSWTVTFDYQPGSVPAAQVTFSHASRVVLWTGAVAPAPPTDAR